MIHRREFAQAVAWLAAFATGRVRPDRSVVVPALPIPHLDPLGDPIPSRALARLGTIRFRDYPRMNRLESMAVSPDGRLIATANLHDPVTLWDAATGRVVRRLGQSPARRPAYSYQIHSVAFSADGATLAVGRPGRVLGRHELRGHNRVVRPLGKVERWDVATGRPLAAIEGHEEPVFGIAYAADGSTLVTADRFGRIVVRDPDSGAVRLQFSSPAERDCLTTIALSADGTLLITGGDQRPLTVWDTRTGTSLRVFTRAEWPESSGCERVVMTPDGATVAGLHGGTIEIWDGPTGEHRLSIMANSSVSDDGGRPAELRHSFDALAITPDGRTLATAGDQDIVRLWDGTNGHELARFEAINRDAVGVAFGPGARSLVAVGSWGTTQVWDLPAGTLRIKSVGHTGPVSRVASASDGRTLTSASDEAVCVWEVETGALLQQLPVLNGRWREWQLSPDGHWLAYQETWEDRRINVLAVRSDQVVHQFDQFRQAEDSSVYFQFAPDGRTLIVIDKLADDLIFAFLDLTTGSERRVVSTGWACEATDWSRCGRPFLSPDGRTLASLASIRGYDDSIALHDALTGQFLHRFALPMNVNIGYPERFNDEAIAFAPDSSLLATIDSEKGLQLHDLPPGRRQVPSPSFAIVEPSALAFDPSGRVIATASGKRSEPGLIQLWDVASGSELGRFAGHQAGIEALAFSPDGRRLASGSWDTTVLIWNVAGLA